MNISNVMPALVVMLAVWPAAAAEWAGTVKAAQGEVVVERDGKAMPVAVGDKVFAREALVTGKDGRVAVTLRDDTLLSTGANSRVVLNEFDFNPATHGGQIFLSVARGITAMVSGLVAKADPKAMRVATPTATIGIRGTEFVVEVADE